MSQERRRRRAESRTRAHQPKPHHDGSTPKPHQEPVKPQRTALQQRKRSMIVLLAIAVAAINAVTWLVTDNWGHRLLMVIVTVLGATVAYFLAINPAKSTGV